MLRAHHQHGEQQRPLATVAKVAGADQPVNPRNSLRPGVGWALMGKEVPLPG